MISYLKQHPRLKLILSELLLVLVSAFIFSSIHQGKVFASCIVQEGQDPAGAGCQNSTANIETLGQDCLTDLNNDLPNLIAVGWDGFGTSPITIVNNAVTPVILDAIGCNDWVGGVGSNEIYWLSDNVVGYANTNNVITLPSYYACGPVYVPCTPAYGQLGSPQVEASGTWTYQEYTLYIDGGDFPASGNYVVSITGYGTPCPPGGPVSPYCGLPATDLETTDLGLDIVLVSVTCTDSYVYTTSSTSYSVSTNFVFSAYTPSLPPNGSDSVSITGIPGLGPISSNYDSTAGVLAVSATANAPPGSYNIQYNFSGDNGLLTATCSSQVASSGTCGSYSADPSGSSEYSISTQFKLTNYTPSLPPNGSDSVSITGIPGLGPISSNYNVVTEVLTATASANAPPGSYPFTYIFTGDSGSLVISCPGLAQSYDQPYSKIFGGDVVVGSGFASDLGLYAPSSATPSCQPDNATGVGVYAWNEGSPNYGGTSTSAGLLSIGPIEGFASANGFTPNGFPVAAPESLTFANDVPAANPYGGDFGTAPCAGIGNGSTAESYYNALQNSPYNINGKNGNPTTLSSGYPVTNKCQNVYVYSGESVTISANISLSNSSCSWTSPSTMPLFYVVVDGGNITIDNNVTNIDGVFIAEPNSSGQGGNIFTCDNVGPQIQMLFSSGSQGCTSQLVINGSFIAKNVDLQRTNGTLSSAKAPTQADSCSTGIDPNAAEVFCYSPMQWLANPLPQTTSLESLSSLPPVL